LEAYWEEKEMTYGKKGGITKVESQGLKQRYGIWLAMPRELRKPPTQKELTETMGVSEVTLSVWQKDPIVVQARDNAVALFLGNDFKWEAIDLLKERCRKGHVGALELAFKIMGVLDNKASGNINMLQDTKIEVVAPKEKKEEKKVVDAQTRDTGSREATTIDIR